MLLLRLCRPDGPQPHSHTLHQLLQAGRLTGMHSMHGGDLFVTSDL